MARKSVLALCWMLLLAAESVFGQGTDPVVVMTIAGKDITRSEFEYSFNKNRNGDVLKDQSAIVEYADMFINYKLKVQAALDARMDTLPSFKEEYAQYRNTQLAPFLVDSAYIDSVARRVYDNVKQTVGDSDLLLMSQILIAIPQNASEEVRRQAKAQADTISFAIRSGADFAFMARTYSQDKATAERGGELPWIGPNTSFPEFTANAYALKSGEVSAPFLSVAGYYILKMRDRKPLESYEKYKKEILKLLKSTGIEAKAVESGVRKLIDSSNGELKNRADVMDYLQKKRTVANPSLNYLFREYYEGLLLYEAVNTLVWKPAAGDKVNLEKFFRKNKKQYTWDAPRFKGFLVQSTDRDLLQKAMKIVPSCKTREEAVAGLRKKLGDKAQRKIFVRYAVYKKGDDSRVDQKVFEKTSAEKKGRYYYDVYGEMIEKPKTYTDDMARVVADYQSYKEKEWVSSLRKKYTCKIYKDVLNTVNNH